VIVGRHALSCPCISDHECSTCTGEACTSCTQDLDLYSYQCERSLRLSNDLEYQEISEFQILSADYVEMVD